MLNPLGAVAPTIPQAASPYYPSSRRFRNPIYLRVEEVPGAARLGPRLGQLAAAGHALQADRHIDRDAVFRLKQEALKAIWAGGVPPRRPSTTIASSKGRRWNSSPSTACWPSSLATIGGAGRPSITGPTPRPSAPSPPANGRGSLPSMAAMAGGPAVGPRGRVAADARLAYRLSSRRRGCLDLARPAGQGLHGGGPARRLQPAGTKLALAGVCAVEAAGGLLRALHSDDPRDDASCGRTAHRSRHGPVSPVLDSPGLLAGRGDLRALSGRRPAGDRGPGEPAGGGGGGGRGPRHGRAGRASAVGRAPYPLRPLALVRAAAAGRVSLPGHGHVDHARPAHAGRAVDRAGPGRPAVAGPAGQR